MHGASVFVTILERVYQRHQLSCQTKPCLRVSIQHPHSVQTYTYKFPLQRRRSFPHNWQSVCARARSFVRLWCIQTFWHSCGRPSATPTSLSSCVRSCSSLSHHIRDITTLSILPQARQPLGKDLCTDQHEQFYFLQRPPYHFPLGGGWGVFMFLPPLPRDFVLFWTNLGSRIV